MKKWQEKSVLLFEIKNQLVGTLVNIIIGLVNYTNEIGRRVSCKQGKFE